MDGRGTDTGYVLYQQENIGKRVSRKSCAAARSHVQKSSSNNMTAIFYLKLEKCKSEIETVDTNIY